MPSANYLIIGDGPTVGDEYLRNLATGRTVVALDGAADKLRCIDLIPNIILGDFDAIEDRTYWGIPSRSENSSEEPFMGNHGVQIVVASDQDLTDMEKGILFSDSLQASSIVITDAIGGRMDHTLGNIRFLKKYHRTERPIEIITDTHRLRYIRDEQFTIMGSAGSPCGIFGFPSAVATTQGLKYDIKDYDLEFAETDSIANSFVQSSATISAVGEALVIW
ncbi:hypothetical protein SCG7086_BG_00060 [Chlamydiales bacterium SCGC AG-110-P3]|nr:hypothetical protein SCG7086_BG_00060 [Chlamydiales bacterium SCGC AG-110-P3]